MTKKRLSYEVYNERILINDENANVKVIGPQTVVVVAADGCHVDFKGDDESVLLIAAENVTFSASAGVVVLAVAWEQCVGDYDSHPVAILPDRVGGGRLKPDTTYQIGGYHARQKKFTEVKKRRRS